MTFIIQYDVYHDNGNLDPHVFASKEDAAAYIQALPDDAEVLPSGDDYTATIYEVGSDTLTEAEGWWLSALHWDLPEGEPLWVLGYEAYQETEQRKRESTPQQKPEVVQDGYARLGATRYEGDGRS